MSIDHDSSVRTDVQFFPELFTAKIPNSTYIPPDRVPNALGFEQFGRPLTGLKKNFLDDLKKSRWFSVDQGRVVFEVRKPTMFYDQVLKKVDEIVISDFDDTLFKAYSWHKKEYELVARDPVLAHRGVTVDQDLAFDFYEKSKILVPGKAISEERYTPTMNLALLTNFAEHRAKGISESMAIDEVDSWRAMLQEMVMKYGDSSLQRIAIDPDFRKLFLNNDPAGFTYDGFVSEILENPTINESRSRKSRALRVIATRGKIEEPLGQIDKVHRSGILVPQVDMVIYTNDLKAGVLEDMSLLVDGIKDRTIHFLDDNKKEIKQLVSAAQMKGISSLRVVQVTHPEAKRKEPVDNLEPIAVIGSVNNPKDTVLRYYSIEDSNPLRRVLL